jgi:DnaJ-class molecular chaperone
MNEQQKENERKIAFNKAILAEKRTMDILDTRYEPCAYCNGSGINATDSELDCPHCDGEGKVCSNCGRPWYGWCMVCKGDLQ